MIHEPYYPGKNIGLGLYSSLVHYTIDGCTGGLALSYQLFAGTNNTAWYW
jgi:hypothetical protein